MLASQRPLSGPGPLTIRGDGELWSLLEGAGLEEPGAQQALREDVAASPCLSSEEPPTQQGPF